jgi:NTP pyrophosphatase (non-canonical NTP hydrolase)
VSQHLTFEELRAANVERCEQSYHPVAAWSPSDWLMCATGELGEVAGELKLMRRGDGVPKEVVGREIADTVIYLDLLAARLGIDLGEAIRDKFNLVSQKIGSGVRL